MTKKILITLIILIFFYLGLFSIVLNENISNDIKIFIVGCILFLVILIITMLKKHSKRKKSKSIKDIYEIQNRK